MKKEVILKIENEVIWLSPDKSLPIEKTDIPIRHLKFKNHILIYWRIVQEHFDKNSRKLQVKILNYSDSDYDTFSKQNPGEIDFIEFGKFDWLPFERNLSIYKKSAFMSLLINADKNPYFFNGPHHQQSAQGFDISKSSFKEGSGEIKEASQTGEQAIQIQQSIQTTIEEKFEVDFNEITILLGYIRLSKYINKLNNTIEFKIENEHLLPEFDNIKYWFSKKLKTRKIRVSAEITLLDDEIIKIHATSKEIDRIDQELIDGIKTQRTLAITKLARPEHIDKSLFTADDYFSLDEKNDLMGNVFQQTETDILELFLDKIPVRNKKELRYISGKLHSLSHKIRFTNHPNFGFIFLVEGELNNHFIWELLNSHATYIWTFGKGAGEIKMQYRKIEMIINTILDCGRENYKRAYKGNNQDDDLIFNVIHHKHKGSELIDEFPKWKHRINELIT